MDHAAFAGLIAGRALGDLDVDEQRSVEAHLPSCPTCRALSRDLDGVLTDLAFSAPPRQAPANLGPSIMAAIRRDQWWPATAPEAVSAPLTPLRVRRSWTIPRLMGVGLAAAAVVVIAVLGLGILDLREQLDAAEQVARATSGELSVRETAMQVVADPTHASAWLEPTHGSGVGSALMVYLPGSTKAYLLAGGLPATPDGRVYQFWYADPSGVHAGPTFRHDGRGMLLIPVEVDLGGAQAAMLTIEPAGGATDTPSEDIVFGALPAS